jgi:hypothetical protein
VFDPNPKEGHCRIQQFEQVGNVKTFWRAEGKLNTRGELWEPINTTTTNKNSTSWDPKRTLYCSITVIWKVELHDLVSLIYNNNNNKQSVIIIIIIINLANLNFNNFSQNHFHFSKS